LNRGDGLKVKTKLFLIHGLCVDERVWQPLMSLKFIAENFECHVLNYPHQRIQDSPFTIKSLVQELQDQIDLHPASSGVILGHSLGGHLSVQLAAQNPQYYLGLIQCSPAKTIEQLFSFFRPSTATQILYQEYWSDLDLSVIESVLFHQHEKMTDILINEPLQNLRRDLGVDLQRNGIIDEWSVIEQLPLRPALFLSTNDAVLNDEYISSSLREHLPHLELIKAGGHGHYAFLEFADEWLNDEVEKWLRLSVKNDEV
jgi:pimeloyl-ACP methyl ester carboxylesterase